MTTPLHWIEFREGPQVAIAARPRAGDWLDDEMSAWKAEGVSLVVSLLESEEIADLGLGCEPDACATAGIAFANYPIRDRGLPRDREEALAFVRKIADSESKIVFHCRAGIGRSSLMAALLMMQFGVAPSEAFARISNARGLRVPDTDEQFEWLVQGDPR